MFKQQLVMNKKVTFNKKTRKDMANPYNDFSHNKLLNIANIQKFNGEYIVEYLQNGKIIVKPTTNRKVLKK